MRTGAFRIKVYRIKIDPVRLGKLLGNVVQQLFDGPYTDLVVFLRRAGVLKYLRFIHTTGSGSLRMELAQIWSLPGPYYCKNKRPGHIFNMWKC